MFTPDGSRLVTGERGGFIRIYDTGSWLEEYSFRAGTFVLALGVSPDSRSLAVAADKEPIAIWDIQTRQVRQRIPARTQFWIRSSVAWSPSGNLLAFGTDAPEARVELWDVASNRSVASLPGHEKDVLAIAFSPDGHLLASGSEDGLVQVWDVNTRTKIASSRRHRFAVFEIAFSPDGRRLASVGQDQTIVISDTRDWREVNTLRGHRDEIFGVRFTPDSARLITGSKDGTIRVWNPEPLSGRAPVFLPTQQDSVTNASWWWPSADGRRFRFYQRHDNRVMSSLDLWNREPFQFVKSFALPTNTYLAQLSTDEKEIAFARDDGALVVQDARTHQELGILAGNTNRLLTLHTFRADLFLPVVRENLDLEVRNWRERRLFRPVGLRTNDFSTLYVSRNERWVALGYNEGREPACTDVWDWPAQRRIASFLQTQISDVAISDDGRLLATASWDAKVRLWDVPSQRLLHTLGGEISAYFAIALSPDGTRLVAGTAHGAIKIWDLTANPPQELGTWQAHTRGDSLHHLAFTPDGNTLFSRATDGLRTWQTAAVENAPTTSKQKPSP